MKGEVVYLYAFDVANEIVTSKVQEILSQKPFPFAIRTEHTYPKDVPIYRPLSVELPPLPVGMNGRPVCLQVRVYDVGVVNVAARVPFEVEKVHELLPFHKAVLDNGQALAAVAKEVCADVARGLRDYMIRGGPIAEPEAYTIFCVTDLDRVQDVNAWLVEQRRAVAGLLSETSPERLSEAQVGEVLRVQRSFEITDLVVIDWDAALVADLSGYVEDVLYVLELANLQLEEFHVIDRNLDQYLDRLYDDLERRHFPLFGGANPVLRKLRRLRVDVTKLADEVTHITKFFGDWYLARIYLGARDRFYLDHWRTSIEQRLAQLDQLYTVVHSEVYEQRMFWLEIIIVVLFVIDVLWLFLGKH